MRFIDRVRILVRAGSGGNGSVSWRREAHVSKGGPAGGNGGRGGDVVLVADEGMGTLLDLKYRQHYKAKSGTKGRGKNMHGRGADELIIKVPVGTTVFYEGEATAPGEPPPWREREDEIEDGDAMEVIYVLPAGISHQHHWLPAEAEEDVEAEPSESPDAATPDQPSDGSSDGSGGHRGDELRDAPDERLLDKDVALGQRAPEAPHEDRVRYNPGDLVGDLEDDGDRLIVAHGGAGGRGNASFRSSANRAPDFAQPGAAGEAHWLRLELKLLADVGIVGYPNVGKSTLIRAISAAKSEVGAYPFTTLVPQLGVVSLSGERTMVVADVPGLVDGAADGRGLGHEFLRHLERTSVLLHLIAPDPDEEREPFRDLERLEEELIRYGGEIFDGRPRVVALNKIDLDEGQDLIRALRSKLRKQNIPLFPISAETGEGVDALLEALWRRLELVRRGAPGEKM